MPTPPSFLDTNVFLYAAGREHPLRRPCQQVLRRVAEGDLRATTNTEVIQELLYVLGRRGLRRQGVKLCRHVLQLVPRPLPVTGDDMRVCCDLAEAYADLPARDAVHAATMLNNGISRVITTDEHFDRLEEVSRVAPDELERREPPP